MKPSESRQGPLAYEFPPSDEPIIAELVEIRQPRRYLKVAGWLALLTIVGVIAGRVLYVTLPGEITRWRVAVAQDRRLSGDFWGAIASLDRIVPSKSDEVLLSRLRAQWKIDAGNYEAALDDCNHYVQLRPNDHHPYILRSEALANLGRFDEALTNWKQIMKLKFPQTVTGRPEALNSLAYFRALANTEIDEALTDIDEAIRRNGEGFAVLDTRGFLYYQKGDDERALKDLSRAADIAEEDYELWHSRSKVRGFGLPDQREQEIEDRHKRRAFAVVLYHRGLVNLRRGSEDLAKRDFQRVVALGFEPGELLF